MSNIIPPLLSDSPPPPPLPTDEDEEDDEFGHFGLNQDVESFAYGCDNLSLPPSPINIPDEDLGLKNKLDINSNSKEDVNSISENKIDLEKDYHDKRKHLEKDINSLNKLDNNVHNEVLEQICVRNTDTKVEKEVCVNNFEEKEINNSESISQGNNIIPSIKENSQAIDNSIDDINISDNIDQSKSCEKMLDTATRQISGCETVFQGCVGLEAGSSSFKNITNCSELEKNITHLNDDFAESIDKSIVSQNIKNENICLSSDITETLTLQYSLNVAVSNAINIENQGTELHNGDICNKDNINIDTTGDNSNFKLTEDKSDYKGSISNDKSDENSGFGNFASADSNEYTTVDDSFTDQHLNLKNVSKIQDFYSGHFDNFHQLSENITDDDEFGDFSVPETKSGDASGRNDSTKTIQTESQNFATFDADFKNFALTESGNINSEKIDNENLCSVKKFSSQSQTIDEDVDDEFGDFTQSHDLKSVTVSSSIKPDLKDQKDLDDDFGEFEEFSNFTQDSSAPHVFLNEKVVFSKSEEILKNLFPIKNDLNVQKSEENKNVLDDPVFRQLMDITGTKAMSYVWLKSSSQNLLLKALNIDVRNILFGPSWNSSMPRFAANLSMAPLEPIKSAVPVLSPVSTNPSFDSSQLTTQNVEIPSAQFDWSGSGLTNPFDYSQTVLLDLDNLASQLVIPNFNLPLPFSATNPSPSPVAELDEWDFWLQTQLSKKSSIEDPKPEPASTLSPDIVMESPPSYDSSPYHVPLRETHINNKHAFVENDSDSLGWLKPTIVTPELSRKNSQNLEIPDDLYEFDITTDNPEPCKKPNENVQKEVISLSDDTKVEFALMPHVVKTKIEQTTELTGSPATDDEFSEFQAAPLPPKTEILPLPSAKVLSSNLGVLPPLTTSNNTVNSAVNMGKPIEPLKPVVVTEPLQPSVIYPQPKSTAQISWPDPGGISEEDIRKFEGIFSKSPPKPLGKEILNIEKPTKAGLSTSKNMPNKNQELDDEWSDFASSDVKPTTCDKPETKMFTEIFEAHTKNSSKKQNYISDEIKHSIPNTKTSTVKMNNPSKIQGIVRSEIKSKPKTGTTISSIKPQKPPLKTNSLEEDDWSDFVSVKTQSPVHKRVTETESRSSTPDLPLSVLNLGSIQPTKQPIPVITPQGLVQTKLSSGNVLDIQSVVQNNHVYQHPSSKPMVQPSLISNVFANQAYGGFNSHINSMPNTRLGNHQEDDEWSDFVSHQPTSSNIPQPGQTSNLPQPRSNPNYFMQPSPNTNWFSAASRQNFVHNQSSFNSGVLKNSDAVIQQRRNNPSVLNISIPELDFVAPKSRTTSRK